METIYKFLVFLSVLRVKYFIGQTIDIIKTDLGKIDLVIYSLASPRRQHPKTGEIFNSTLKPIGKNVTLRGINTDKEEIQEFSLDAASEDDILQTVAVMGGEDCIYLCWREGHLGPILEWNNWSRQKRFR